MSVPRRSSASSLAATSDRSFDATMRDATHSATPAAASSTTSVPTIHRRQRMGRRTFSSS